MKIHFYEVGDSDAKVLQEIVKGHTLTFYPSRLAELTVPNEADVVSVFVGSKIGKSELDFMPNLKAIMVRATGFDNIDLEECKKRNVVVCNVPAYGADTVAEFTFALLLAVTRKVVEANARVKVGGSFMQDGLCGIELQGKTLGVLGTGKIGSRVAKIALGFGMKVLAYDLFKNTELEKLDGVSYVEADELVRGSHVITLHLPYTEDNHHWFNDERFGEMKQGSYLVNTARGALVDTKALLKVIESGHLAGAALDVLEFENYLKDETDLVDEKLKGEEFQEVVADFALRKYPNVILTPHVAYYTSEAVRRILETTAENIASYESGSPKNVVSLT